jgi:hypothetical protein
VDAFKLEASISKMMEMASELEDPAPDLREVDMLERARNALLSKLAGSHWTRLHMNARSITESVSIWGLKWRPQGDSTLSPGCR